MISTGGTGVLPGATSAGSPFKYQIALSSDVQTFEALAKDFLEPVCVAQARHVASAL